MLRNIGATACAIVTRDVPTSNLVIYLFVTRQVSTGQDKHIFL